MENDRSLSVKYPMPPGCGCVLVAAVLTIGTLATAAALLGLVAALKFLIEFLVR